MLLVPTGPSVVGLLLGAAVSESSRLRGDLVLVRASFGSSMAHTVGVRPVTADGCDVPGCVIKVILWSSSEAQVVSVGVRVVVAGRISGSVVHKTTFCARAVGACLVWTGGVVASRVVVARPPWIASGHC